jgi:hypothetical protein
MGSKNVSNRKFTRSATVAILGAAIAAAWGTIPAGAVTATGIAVGSVGSNIQVGTLPVGGVIQYFIPLGNDNGIYGAASSCPAGFGTCSDTGDGGGVLRMFLRFSPVSTTANSTLTIVFQDLDLKNANDPIGFLEKVNVINPVTHTSLTGGYIDTIGGLIIGDANLQTLTVSLGILSANPFYLKLLFRAESTFRGTNTPEYLLATITSPNPAPEVGHTPLPGALWLMGTVLFGAAGLAKWRKRRRVAVEI